MTPGQELLLEEYRGARSEVRERARFLHTALSLGVILEATAAVGWAGLVLFHASTSLQHTFLLLQPVIFATLAFNYQANQMTLEAVAGFSDRLRSVPDFKVETASWDQAYGTHKRGYELTSFLKIMSLMLPLLLPFVVIGLKGGFPQGGNGVLCAVDVALFLLVVANFRYKIS